MVTHVVIFAWLEDVSPEQIEGFRQALDQLAADLSAIATIRHGPDLRFRDGNGDYALIATFPDRASWDEYRAHPKHKAFVRDYVQPIQASRLTIQFQGKPEA